MGLSHDLLLRVCMLLVSAVGPDLQRHVRLLQRALQRVCQLAGQRTAAQRLQQHTGRHHELAAVRDLCVRAEIRGRR